jgi:hypothetical protein
VNAELKLWFLRDVLESLERERGEGALVRLLERVPERLRGMLKLDTLRSKSPLDAIPLDEGEELLLCIDSALGDGTGRVLELVGSDLAGRMYFQEGGSVILGDLMATAARLRATLQRPFVGTEIVFELSRTDSGFSLVVGVSARPRSTKILRSLAAGAMRAAQRYAHESGTSELRLSAETLGDRSVISIGYRSASQNPPKFDGADPGQRRRSPISFKPPRVPSLAAEVERILGGRGNSEPPALRSNGDPASKRPSARPASVRPEPLADAESDDTPPTRR